ncbi:MAG TPA: HD domain-containing protein [Flavisolibacter sp.]|nr:HD domain-containing protein [Flavisolibacter sp.]
MNREQAEIITSEIFSLYEQFGNSDYIGEPVSQIEHMCQAAQLAEKEGYDDEIILAAFFHDLGHLTEYIMPVVQMDGVGVADHEGIGAQYLRERGFSDKLCRLVQSHVAAKRYLTWKYPDYYQQLSPASKITLSHQGGVMDDEEAILFEADDLHTLYIKLREWDDKAKQTDQPLPDLDRYRQMAERHLMNVETPNP